MSTDLQSYHGYYSFSSLRYHAQKILRCRYIKFLILKAWPWKPVENVPGPWAWIKSRHLYSCSLECCTVYPCIQNKSKPHLQASLIAVKPGYTEQSTIILRIALPGHVDRPSFFRKDPCLSASLLENMTSVDSSIISDIFSLRGVPFPSPPSLWWQGYNEMCFAEVESKDAIHLLSCQPEESVRICSKWYY